MATCKTMIPAVALTLLLSGVLWAAGNRADTVFALRHWQLADHSLFWSWPLFLVTFGLARALAWMLDA